MCRAIHTHQFLRYQQARCLRSSELKATKTSVMPAHSHERSGPSHKASCNAYTQPQGTSTEYTYGYPGGGSSAPCLVNQSTLQRSHLPIIKVTTHSSRDQNTPGNAFIGCPTKRISTRAFTIPLLLLCRYHTGPLINKVQQAKQSPGTGWVGSQAGRQIQADNPKTTGQKLSQTGRVQNRKKCLLSHS